MDNLPKIKILPKRREPDGSEGFLVEVAGYLPIWMSVAELCEVFPGVDVNIREWQDF